MYPGGVRAIYSYDYADREATLSVDVPGEPLLPVVGSASYLPMGPLTELALGNGLVETHLFDERYYPRRITVTGGSALLDWQYTLDSEGNPTAITDLLAPAGNRTYGYQDFQYYLALGNGPWGELSWEYDRIGSRKRETRDGVVDVYSYVPNGMGGNTAKLDEIALGAGGTKVYQFDAAGNQSQVTTGADEVVMSHDEANQLAVIERPAAGVRAEMLYDGRGFLRQAEEQHPGQIFADGFETGGPACWSAVVGGAGGGAACPLVPSVGPVYSSDGVLHYQLKEGALERYVFYFAGRPVLTLAVPAGGAAEPLFLAADHLGTPILASDGAGAEVWAGGFKPFGGDISGASGQGIFLRLAGQWDDEAWAQAVSTSELSYNVYRWLGTAIGRYLTPDPLGQRGSLNTYIYADAKPMIAVDPLGLLVQLYCVPVGYGDGFSLADAAGAAGYKHCFVRVRCDCSPQYDLRLEVTGEDGNTGRAIIPDVPPAYGAGHGGNRVAFKPADNDSSDCAMEDCIVQEYHRRRQAGQPYGGWFSGPNSNTFAGDILRACGVRDVIWPSGTPPYTGR